MCLRWTRRKGKQTVFFYSAHTGRGCSTWCEQHIPPDAHDTHIFSVFASHCTDAHFAWLEREVLLAQNSHRCVFVVMFLFRMHSPTFSSFCSSPSSSCTCSNKKLQICQSLQCKFLVSFPVLLVSKRCLCDLTKIKSRPVIVTFEKCTADSGNFT